MKRFINIIILIIIVMLVASGAAFSCTTIMVGKKASRSGSVMTSHTCDSRQVRTWIDIQPRRTRQEGEECLVYMDMDKTEAAHDFSKARIVGEIPQTEETFGYINSGYPCMNEFQLAIGESTFTGREELQNKDAMIHCSELCRLILERTKTARDAIRLVDELTKKYGYNDAGECLSIADKKEVWQLEIMGCGRDRIGAVWAAQRIPDGHIGVCANASRIREIDLDNPDYFMASENVFSLAEEMGWWDPGSGKPFEFCYVYNPEGRKSMASRRREWRVFDLVAPSLKLDPNAENYPFSIRPDNPVSVQDIMAIFRDTFEGTEFDMTKFMLVEGEDGKMVKSPYANPFMDYDMMPLFKINGGWGKLGERCIARYYCTYATVTQSRDWLPDPIGGLVWLGFDNPAMTVYAPIYCGIYDLPNSYKICGRPGFNRDCAWWAFNRVADLSAQKWGDMRCDVEEVRKPIEDKSLADQQAVEAEAQKIYYNQGEEEARRFLTDYTDTFCEDIVARYWDLGDHIWSKYTGKF